MSVELPVGVPTEPFLVTSVEIGTCGIGAFDGHLPCRRAAKWAVESIGYDGGPAARQPEAPTDLACTLHLAAVCAARLAWS